MTAAAATRRTLGIGTRVRVRFAPRTVAVCAGTTLATLVLVVLACGTGDYPIPVGDVLAAFAGQGDTATDFIVLNLRLPRSLVALGVGMALGTSGALFQSITRNPLGSPDIIGFTWGASAGAVLAIVAFGASALGISAAAIAGGAVAAFAVYVLAMRRGVQGYRLILVGIGVSAMLTAVVHYLLARAELTQATAAQVWVFGTLNGRDWEQAVPVLVALAVLLPLVAVFARSCDMLEMGDDAARALGVRVEPTRLVIVALGVLLAGTATAACGPIQFVALAAPQVARRLTRATGVGVAGGALMGGFLLVASDFAAQRVFGGVQLPVGVVTAAIGGLYLAWLLAREWKAGR